MATDHSAHCERKDRGIARLAADALSRTRKGKVIALAGLLGACLGVISSRSGTMLPIILMMYCLISLTPVVLHVSWGRVLPFRPDMFVTIAFGLYSLPVAIDVAFLGNSFGLNITLVEKGLLLASATLMAFLAGYYLKSAGLRTSVPRNDFMVVHRWISWLIVLGGIMLWGLHLEINLGGISQYILETTRSLRFATKVGQGYLTIGIPILVTGWIMLFADALYRLARRRMSSIQLFKATCPYLFFFVVYALFFLLTGDRRQIVALALGLIFVFVQHRFRGALNPKHIALASIVSLMLLVGAQVFSKVRGLSHAPIEMLRYARGNFTVDWLNLARGELGAAFQIIVQVLQDFDVSSFMLGRTYLDAVVALVPAKVYPGRPLTPTSWYAAVYHPTAYETGGGVGFSFVAEAYLNFGIAGPLIMGLALGIALSWWYQKTAAHENNPLRVALYGASLGYMFLIFRSDAGSILKEFLFGVVLPVVLATSVTRLVTRKGVLRHRRSPPGRRR